MFVFHIIQKHVRGPRYSTRYDFEVHFARAQPTAATAERSLERATYGPPPLIPLSWK